MKTFELRNGDLVIGPMGFATLSGTAKVRQDLGVAAREPYGCDRFHPRWGSLLTEFTGHSVTDEMELLIRSEITRLIKNYVAQQTTVLTEDMTAGRRSRFGSGEVVRDITSIDIRQMWDRFYVRVRVLTMSGEEVALLATVRS